MPAAVKYTKAGKIYSRSHLGKVFRTKGLEDFTLEIPKGELFGLLGLNGAGKTTAMKLLLGLLFPTSGGVEIMGLPAGTDEVKRKIGYLPELPYFYPWLTPGESLEFYGRLSGAAPRTVKTRVPEIIKLVGLDPHKNKKLGEFSKGMLQRVGLAQALVHDPDIIVLDEPVSGLDPLAIWDFRELFTELNRAGKTIFLSSHSISEVEKICHRVGIMSGGKLVRLLGQDEWRGQSGGLEVIFVEAVKGK
ncbi:MAG: ABC transporter ATP-binding protein [Elusimicrobiaceae bacterium]